MLTLWHCHDARSFRPLWALEELGLDYELKMLPFPPRVHQKTYLGENPLGTIPLLVDGTTRMTESAAILDYLSARHGGGRLSLPVDHPEFGAYLNWLHHGEATLSFPQAVYFRYTALEPDERRQPQVAEDYKKWYLARLRLAEATLADGRDHLVGETFTMADISVAYALLLSTTVGLGEDMPPNCRGWMERLFRRPGYLAARRRQDEAAREAGLPVSLVP